VRPEVLVAVCGTGTGVGKTWVAARLLERLRAGGVAVAARKPVQSADPEGGPTDAETLASAAGQEPQAVTPRHRTYPLAMAPPMAAEALDRPGFTLSELVAEVNWPAATAVGLLETVGGVRSPLATDGDSADLVDALCPDLVLLVTEAGLGAINAVRLGAAVLQSWPTAVFLNHHDGTSEVHRRTAAWLADRDGFEVFEDIATLATRVAPGALPR